MGTVTGEVVDAIKMAQQISQEKILKEKVQQVLKQVQNVNKEKVAVVLEYYEHDVARVVEAFHTDGAKEALEEWNFDDSKPSAASKKKKKNKNNKMAAKPNDANHDSVADVIPSKSASSSAVGNNASSILVNGAAKGPPTGDMFGNGSSSTECMEYGTSGKAPTERHKAHDDYKQHINKRTRDRTLSEISTSSSVGADGHAKSPHAGLEKSCKDLHRQAVSLQRLHIVLNEQVDKSFKRVTEVFKELHNQLNIREAEVIFELEKVKHQANDVLTEQQRRASALKSQTDRAQVMSEKDVAILRNSIKSYVSERKLYEDLSNTQRVSLDFTHMMEEIKKFGEVIPIKPPSSLSADHVPLSIVAVDSSVVRHDSSIPSPASTTTSSSDHPLLPPVPASLRSTKSPALAKEDTDGAAAAVLINSARVLTQSESLTRYETMEMKQRLANLSLDDTATADSTLTNLSRSVRPNVPYRGGRGGSGGRGGRGEGRGGYRGRGRGGHDAGHDDTHNNTGDHTSSTDDRHRSTSDHRLSENNHREDSGRGEGPGSRGDSRGRGGGRGRGEVRGQGRRGFGRGRGEPRHGSTGDDQVSGDHQSETKTQTDLPSNSETSSGAAGAPQMSGAGRSPRNSPKRGGSGGVRGSPNDRRLSPSKKLPNDASNKAVGEVNGIAEKLNGIDHPKMNGGQSDAPLPQRAPRTAQHRRGDAIVPPLQAVGDGPQSTDS